MDKEKENLWKGILVCLEWEGQEFHPVSYELLGEARRLAQISREPVYAVGVGRGIHEGARFLRHCGAQKVILCETCLSSQPQTYADLYEKYIRELSPSSVLVGGTLEGRALAPRMAVRFRTGLTADCTRLDMSPQGGLVQIRPAFGGNLMAQIVTENSRPQFATVRPGVMEREEEAREESRVRLDAEDRICGTLTICEEELLEPKEKITDARLLVVAGRGVKKKEDLEMLRSLADKLGGQLASSRALVEKGWTSPSQQIGLSGNTVSPDYMLTFGVSGTVQFMAGMRGTRHIIAVNTDPDARIFQIAHDPICADLYEVLPGLMDLVDKRQQEEIF